MSAVPADVEPGDLGHEGLPLDEPRGPHGEPLGTTTDIASTPGESNSYGVHASRWQLLRVAQRLLGRADRWVKRKGELVQAPYRTTWCQCRLAKSWDGAEAQRVHIWRTERRAWFSNVQVCGSPWNCPVCAARIAQVRRRYLRELEGGAREQGLAIGLNTLTIRHGYGDDLHQLLDRLGEARRKMRSGRAWQRFRDRWQWIGEARTLEVTHGANGWHPHFHAMHFCERAPRAGAEATRFRRQLYCLWARACRKAGLPLPSYAHGVDVQWGRSGSDNPVADYIAKWGFAGEVTGQQSKSRGKGGRTPWQLLAGAVDSARDRALWMQYAEGFEGRNQLVLTPGLKKRLQPLQLELDDVEAAQPEQEPEPGEEPVIAASIESADWHLVVRARCHELVLAAAMEGREAVDGVIDDLRRRYRPPDPEPAPSMWGVH